MQYDPPPHPLKYINAAFVDHTNAMASMYQQRAMLQKIAAVCHTALTKGGTIYWCGNGGSAADCQHLAAELVGRFKRERGPYASVALTTDTSVLTAVGNDYGFEHVFARQVQALLCPNDVLFCLSTSGNSPNVLRAAEAARRNGALVVGLTGRGGGFLSPLVDYGLFVACTESAHIQECHIFAGHVICGLIEGDANEWLD